MITTNSGGSKVRLTGLFSMSYTLHNIQFIEYTIFIFSGIDQNHYAFREYRLNVKLSCSYKIRSMNFVEQISCGETSQVVWLLNFLPMLTM